MADFQFLKNPISKKWVVLSPRRAKRPDIAKGMEPVCPFCAGREGEEKELYRVPPVQGEQSGETSSANASDSTNWQVRVLNNKFPFAPVHEVIIHSPDHSKNFDELPLEHVQLIIQTYKQRYLKHQNKGQVYIFHNRGEKGGESLPHPHTQLAVFPFEVKADTPRLDPSSTSNSCPRPAEELAFARDSSLVRQSLTDQSDKEVENTITIQTKYFYLFCPLTSQWPDEVWIAPKRRGRAFSEITDEEITDFSFALSRLIQIFNHRHGRDFPFNFYIYPGGDWYLRLIPRLKVIGGFELSTGIFVNTQDPKETIAFIKEHFDPPGGPDFEKIQSQHQAGYGKTA